MAIDPTKKCPREDQLIATGYSYTDLKLVGIVAQGTQRKVLMMGGPLGYIIKRGDCVGKEKAYVKDVGTGYITFVLDPDTSEPLPRTGRQTGRAAVYDIPLRAHWGGVISGDEVTIDWDLYCPCGRISVAFEKDIIRYSEKQGVDDDRITCAATHEVHNEAVDFMKAFES